MLQSNTMLQDNNIHTNGNVPLSALSTLVPAFSVQASGFKSFHSEIGNNISRWRAWPLFIGQVG
ncbi:hypothetical protein [Vibrio rumoiensis]|uniref:Uncharacterized protein n=1 Tax=Vibrio rumoiensis 1S-45 TaxID=1188252 RepID=A0A1E5E417_9VIBR|nr:hypothetical protein [Vibrio rumoiensis]OEF27437.1 hypothetical protein A1QC_14940 [Vibrio rumoiensis 1S-45]